MLRPLSRRAIGLGVLLVGVSTPAVAGPPMSRGQQFFSITHQECLDRATRVLTSAGYSLWGQLGNGPWGDRGQHSAVILCEPAAGDREVVNIVVASDGTNDGNVPGAERVRLQELMAGGTAPAPSPPPPQGPPPTQASSKGCVGFHGTWDTTFGVVVVRVQGNSMEGDYTAYNGKVSGTVGGNVLDGQYSVPDGRRGSFRWTLAADGDSFTGSYQDADNPSNAAQWNGWCGGGLAASALQNAAGAASTRLVGRWHQLYSNQGTVIEIRPDGTGVFVAVSEDHRYRGVQVGDLRWSHLRETGPDTLQAQFYLRFEPTPECGLVAPFAVVATAKLSDGGTTLQFWLDDYRVGSGCQPVPLGASTSAVYRRE